MDRRALRLGIDVGSTTAKAVVLGQDGTVVFWRYGRHNAQTVSAVRGILAEAEAELGAVEVRARVTGSAGIGIAERFGLGFTQEVIAAGIVARDRFPSVRTLIDIGGEDAKMIFFDRGAAPDIRMNGACAGGTGAFIDQMATLLGLSVQELDQLAARHTEVHPIAARCGVFAKTDVQNLLAREVPREDVAASVLSAVAWQTLATLGRGRTVQPAVLLAGGPLTFLPSFRDAFARVLGLGPSDILEVENAQLLPALGAALAADQEGSVEMSLDAIARRLAGGGAKRGAPRRLVPLFENDAAFLDWSNGPSHQRVARVALSELQGSECFLGIDSGSTTTKLILVDGQGRVAHATYQANDGHPIAAARAGLEDLLAEFARLEHPPLVARTVVTGYGEDLIRAAFGCEDGIVETVAHFRGARAFEPRVSFVLDIGGQDMKAIFVREGRIHRIAVNEACSSGCGTFIETFARSLGMAVDRFARLACTAPAPCDLGTRCTVFMNTAVKQSLREGADVGCISAGLAYAVVRNALNKVLKVTDPAVLGDHVVVQGGAFRNPAVHRALERVLGRHVVCPDIAELMGAYGAALTARDTHLQRRAPVPAVTAAVRDAPRAGAYRKQQVRCRGCENECVVSQLTFDNGNRFFTGNRCERSFSGAGRRAHMGRNLHAEKLTALFRRSTEPSGQPLLTIGLPRVLNMYEDFPFWCALFVACGFRVKLSDPSSRSLYEAGVGTVMSENICFPAKVAHGHLVSLVLAGVDRIFYPMVFYGAREFTDAVNTYNCPIVAGYPDVIRSAVDPAGDHAVPLDQPPITFHDRNLLARSCQAYLSRLGVAATTQRRAFEEALAAQRRFKAEVRRAGAQLIEEARRERRPLVVLVGRPYHLDPLVNHDIPRILADMGANVITEDAVPLSADQELRDDHVLTQWSYANRMYHAAHWVGQEDGAELVQLNSFGCGPDAIAVDEVGAIMEEHGKHQTLLRIDEIDSTGSVRLRLRSLLETLGDRPSGGHAVVTGRRTTRLFRSPDREKIVLVPEISRFCSPPIVRPLRELGYRIEQLPSSDNDSVEVGLKYVNNEICYPGVIVIGDMIKALQSGAYDPDDVVAGSWETGGQCRASNISCLLKKALVAAGFEHVPVITLSTRMRSVNRQPGLKLNVASYLQKAILGMVYTDALSALYHATAAREAIAGEASALADRYLTAFERGLVPLRRSALLASLRSAVSDFNAVPTREGRLPAVGIVGEIYVKYNPFVNNRVADWLMERGCEVVLPPLMTYFAASVLNWTHAVRAGIQRPSLRSALGPALNRYVHGFIEAADAAAEGFHFHRPHVGVHEIAATAGNAVSLNHQYGEGWLLPGEIGSLVHSGVPNVLCLQPFGCIANHVVAKGVARRLHALYPELNLLFLDLDASGSEVSALNRLHFFAEQAHAGLVPALAPAPVSKGPRV